MAPPATAASRCATGQPSSKSRPTCRRDASAAPAGTAGSAGPSGEPPGASRAPRRTLPAAWPGCRRPCCRCRGLPSCHPGSLTQAEAATGCRWNTPLEEEGDGGGDEANRTIWGQGGEPAPGQRRLQSQRRPHTSVACMHRISVAGQDMARPACCISRGVLAPPRCLLAGASRVGRGCSATRCRAQPKEARARGGGRRGRAAR